MTYSHIDGAPANQSNSWLWCHRQRELLSNSVHSCLWCHNNQLRIFNTWWRQSSFISLPGHFILHFSDSLLGHTRYCRISTRNRASFSLWTDHHWQGKIITICSGLYISPIAQTLARLVKTPLSLWVGCGFWTRGLWQEVGWWLFGVNLSVSL